GTNQQPRKRVARRDQCNRQRACSSQRRKAREPKPARHSRFRNLWRTFVNVPHSIISHRSNAIIRWYVKQRGLFLTPDPPPRLKRQHIRNIRRVSLVFHMSRRTACLLFTSVFALLAARAFGDQPDCGPVAAKRRLDEPYKLRDHRRQS